MTAQVVKKAAASAAASPLSDAVDKVITAIRDVELSSDVLISISLAEELGTPVEKKISAETEALLLKEMRAIVRKGPAQDEERYVLGVVLEPLKEMGQADLQQDTYSAAEVQKACYAFMQDFGNLGLQHQKYINGRVKILENWITRDDSVIDGQSVTKGTWLLGVRVVDDDLWTAVKKGEITGFSVGGTAQRGPVAV